MLINLIETDQLNLKPENLPFPCKDNNYKIFIIWRFKKHLSKIWNIIQGDMKQEHTATEKYQIRDHSSGRYEAGAHTQLLKSTRKGIIHLCDVIYECFLRGCSKIKDRKKREGGDKPWCNAKA